MLDAGTDELVGDPGVRALAIAMMDEVAAVAPAHGHPVGDGFGDRMVRNTETMVPYAPSMKLDFDAGRPMELAAIYDAPLAMAASLGWPMPHVETVAAQLHLLDARANSAHVLTPPPNPTSGRNHHWGVGFPRYIQQARRPLAGCSAPTDSRLSVSPRSS